MHILIAHALACQPGNFMGKDIAHEVHATQSAANASARPLQLAVFRADASIGNRPVLGVAILAVMRQNRGGEPL